MVVAGCVSYTAASPPHLSPAPPPPMQNTNITDGGAGGAEGHRPLAYTFLHGWTGRTWKGVVDG